MCCLFLSYYSRGKGAQLLHLQHADTGSKLTDAKVLKPQLNAQAVGDAQKGDASKVLQECFAASAEFVLHPCCRS